jgi:branched-chain amino acid transport system permease protein
VSIILQHLALMIWSRNILAFPQIIPSKTYFVGGAAITTVQMAILAICFALMASLAILVYRTPLGTAMRATAQNPHVAGLMGIDINRVIAVTFVIGAGLGAVAGVLFGTYYGIAQYTMGAVLGLKAFSAAVLGGIGNIPGAMLGGVLLGLVEALGAGYIGDLTDLCRWGVPLDACEGGSTFILFGSNYQDVFAFVVLILVLVFRPQGLLGERVGERA